MGIPLGDGRVSLPGIKFRVAGQYIDLALVSTAKVPWRDYATGKQKVTDEGQPREQEVVTALVVRGTAVISENDVDRVPVEGEQVALYIAGHHRWDYVQAQKQHAGGLMVGDLMRVTYTGEVQGQGVQPRKVWAYQFRHPTDAEAGLLAQCEALHRQASGTPLAGASASGGGASAYDPEPF